MTNQASEDKQTKAIYEAMQIPYLSERHDAIKSLIRNEKLKLLADVRERVVGEDEVEDIDLSKSAKSRWGVRARNRVRDEHRELLTKLEAEL